MAELLNALHAAARGDWQVIVVDDGSSDGTIEVLQRECPRLKFELIFRPENGGKSAAVRDGLAASRGEYVLVQDADLEYDPRDISGLLAAIQQPGDVIYGRRPSCWIRPSRWLFASGVLFIDLALLVVYRRFIRDHATCYKLLPRRTLESFKLESTGFEGCIEITAKLMRSQIPIYQIPIRYSPRTKVAGKKLTFAYGLRALRSVWRWRNWSPREESGS